MRLVVDLNRLEGFDEWVEKARKGEQIGGSYIYRENIPEKVTAKNGKTVTRRYRYYYVADMLKDTADKILKNIGSFFFKGNPEEVKRIEKSYETENIQKDYGADKKTWYQHVMEYFSHRALWDKRFSDKTAAERWKKPVKTAVAEKVDVKGMETPAESAPEIKTSAEAKKPEKKWKANPSLMRKVWSLYTGKLAEKQEKQTETAAKVIEENKKKAESAKNDFQIEQILSDTAEKEPEKIKFTRENFNKLFKNGVDTPIEKVKVGEHQFEKLEEKGRTDLLASMYETLKNPSAIAQAENGAKLYIKSFIGKQRQKNIVSVVVDKGELHIAISTHEERLKQIEKKITGILYKKNSGYNGVETPYDGTVRNESVADKTYSVSIDNIPQSGGKVKDSFESLSRCKSLYNEAYRQAMQDLRDGKTLQIDDDTSLAIDDLAEDKQAAELSLRFYTTHFTDWNSLDTVNATLEMYAEEPDDRTDENVIRMAKEKAVQDSLRAYLGLNVNLPESEESEAEKHKNRSDAMLGNQNARKDFKDLSDIIKNKSSLNLKNDSIGEIKLTYAVNKSDLKHIIERRYAELKNKYHIENEDERRKLLTAFVYSLLQTVKHGSAEIQKDGRSYILRNSGISAIARQNSDGKIVVTGFVDNSNEKEGAETISAVNAEYGYAPEFLELYASVGAALSASNIPQNEKLSNNGAISAETGDNNSGGNANGENNTGAEPAGLSERAGDLRSGRGEEPGSQNAAGAARGDNGIEAVLGLDTSGNGLGNADSSVNIGRGRITKGQAREIRRQCREILQKPDYAITAEDKAVLAQYVGAGGTGEEGSANSGVLYEFYTPRNVISKVWQIVDKYNPDQGKTVIEPSSGIGRFAEGRKEKFTMFELEDESARIAHILHPDADVVQGAFQENFMKNKGGRFTKKFKPYDVAVGNPPYGAYTGKYKGLGEGKEYKRYETYFMSRTLDTLKDGGVMAMVVPSGFMDGKSTYGKDIEKIAEKGELLEAWRLPNGTFDSTDVGTDIVVFRKGKGGSAEQIKSYFEKNPDHIAGEISTRTNRFGKEESYVKPKDGQTFESAVDSIDVGARETKEQADAISELIGAKETEAEKHQNRSEAMKGNQNARKLDISDKLKDTGRTGTARNGKNYKIWDTTDDFWSIYKQKKDALKENGYQLVKTRAGWKIYDYNTDGENSSEKTDTEKKENRSRAMLGNKNAEGGHNVSVNPNAHKMSVEEFNKKYGKNFDPKDIPIWKATDRSGNIDITRLSNEEVDYVAKSGHYVKDGGMYVNVVNYASGNIREKLNALSSDDPQYEVKKALLEAVCPKEKKIGEFTLSPITDWAREYKTADGKSLIDGFFEWAYNGNGYYSAGDSPVAREEIPPDISFNDIKDFIDKVPYQMSRAESRDFDDKKQREKAKERRKQQRRETAIKLFNRYLQEGLALDEQKRLTEAWNLKANSFVNPDFTKIPVFVDGMSTHKGGNEFTLFDQQMKGISMLTNKGTGLLAYDVGVGKTACGVVATVNQIQTGRAKRPLICVPKAVYSNWIDNIHELFPDIKVNGLGNLSKSFWNSGMTIEPGSISVCTYEGLENISFNAQEEAELKEDIEFAEYTDSGEKQTARQKASKDEKINERIGNIQKTRDEGVQFSDLGFDHITVDEVHNFRNLFKMPRHIKKNKEDEDKVESNEFDGLGAGGEPSERAKKLFAITQLIQRHNDGRNTFLLSATPFQNSPTEIYSILSYMARDELKKRGFYSLEQFVSNFCKVQREYVVKANRVTEAPVVKGFENLKELQNLLISYMDKVDGEEAGVVRPYKRMHAPELELSEMQKDIMDNISNYIEEQEQKPKKERDDGYMFRAMNAMKNCALSPALVTDTEFNPYGGKKLDFVETSPKLKFVCDSIIAQYKKDSHNGQIMYMPLGVEQFPKVKDYLVKHGMPKDAIATISGGATTDKAMEARDSIFNDFNDVNGKCKVIIGSSTIKEGCNLQGNTTTIYCTQLDWNPTDVQQLWGRGWRQGNRQGIVHCVTPLMHDSLDPMIYQKHDEKSSRTNDIYSYKGDAMNSQDVNPEELKFSLIKDPEKRADLQVMEYSEKNKSDEKMYGQLIDVLHKQIDIAFESDKEIESRCNTVLPFRMNRTLEGLLEENKRNKAGLDSAKKAITVLTKKYKGKDEKWNEDYSKITEELNALDISNLYISTFRTQSFDETIGDLNASSRSLQANIDSNNSYIRMYNKTKTKLEKTREATKKYLESKGMKSKADCEQKIQDYVKLMDTAKENAAKAKDMRDEFYKKAVEDNARNEKNLLSVDELVKENVDSIMGDLHLMDDDFKAKIKTENDRRFGRVAKSLPLFFIMDGRLYINRSRIGM